MTSSTDYSPSEKHLEKSGPVPMPDFNTIQIHLLRQSVRSKRLTAIAKLAFGVILELVPSQNGAG
jgi:hypothetical protein